MRGEVVDTLLADLPETLQNAEPGRVGKGQKVVRKLVPRALEKHNACFIRV
jgi:hypothetical protein